MESKFKARDHRRLIVITAATLLLLAAGTRETPLRLGLGLAAPGLVWLWHRADGHWRVAELWLPALIAALLSLALLEAPQHYSIWLWGWVGVLALPQPLPMRLVVVLLAALGYWQIHPLLTPEARLLAALVLIALGLLACGQAVAFQTSRRNDDWRPLALPDLAVHSRRQLERDLTREIARTTREGSSADLLLLQARPGQLAELARLLDRHTRRYEALYQCDRRTLAVIFISRTPAESRQRREQLYSAMPAGAHLRLAGLTPGLSLPAQIQALAHQTQPIADAGAH
ncbi:hypothetical protein KGQ90_01845 [Modicisalibacter tunisiensis]|uniref:hypothetical protein n=1 Tax=Modicisalibacter tunisiensis TaxID=390637 RepID=UPI001CCCFFE4|nr:hypothetical protein [Modicisalibacter tunisiensis]MBZ9537684.1 hypothetical protein [Modicisalibacter tunisiensis]